jgi:hypothetical protein
VRRTRLLGPQATLWPDWRYHPFVTDRQGSAVMLDADHRRHAVCKLTIRDLKDGAPATPLPSRVFLSLWPGVLSVTGGGRGSLTK